METEHYRPHRRALSVSPLRQSKAASTQKGCIKRSLGKMNKSLTTISNKKSKRVSNVEHWKLKTAKICGITLWPTRVSNMASFYLGN